MSDFKIAIISKNKSLSRLFELEALNMGISVRTFERTAVSAFDCALTIIDIDTVEVFASIDVTKTAFISAKNVFPSFCDKCIKLSWPILADDIHKIYEDYKNQTRSLNKKDITEVDDHSDVIVFYKNSPNTVRYGQRNVSLSQNEVKMLTLLCENVGNMVSKEDLKRALGSKDEANGNLTEVYIYKLRKKLEASFGKRLIFTVRSYGYKIIAGMEWE